MNIRIISKGSCDTEQFSIGFIYKKNISNVFTILNKKIM